MRLISAVSGVRLPASPPVIKIKAPLVSLQRGFFRARFEPDPEIGQISADFERGRFAKVSIFELEKTV